MSGAIKELASQGLDLADAKDEVGRSAQSALLVLAKQTDQTAELSDAYSNSTGSAADMAKVMDNTSQGALARMGSAIEGAQIAFGKVLAPVVEKVAGFIENLANKFTSLTDGQKKTIAIVAGVAAAIGPLLVIIPQLVSVAAVAGPALGAAFTAMTGPIGIAVAALAALTAAFFYFWDEIKVPLSKAINMVISFYNENESIRIAIALLKQQFINTFTIAKQMVMNVVNSFGVLFNAIKAAITDGFGAGFDVLKQGMKEIADETVQTGKDVYNSYADAVNEARQKNPIEFVTADDLNKGMDRLKSLFSFNLGGGGAVSGAIDDIADSASNLIKPLEQAEQVIGKMDKTLKDVGTSVAEGIPPIGRLRQEFVEVIDMGELTQAAFVGIGEAIRGLASGATTGSAILGQAFTTLGNFLKKIGSAMVGQAVAMREFQLSLITNPIKATAMGVAFVASGALLANYGQQLTEGVALAKGGLAFGETLAVVGDNPGASFDPEVIAPLSKLEKMMGGGAVQVYGRISGSDILLSNARAERDRNRTF